MRLHRTALLTSKFLLQQKRTLDQAGTLKIFSASAICFYHQRNYMTCISPNIKVIIPQSLAMTYNMQVRDTTLTRCYLYDTTLIRCYLQSVDFSTQKILQQYCLNSWRELNRSRYSPFLEPSDNVFLLYLQCCSSEALWIL